MAFFANCALVSCTTKTIVLNIIGVTGFSLSLFVYLWSFQFTHTSSINIQALSCFLCLNQDGKSLTGCTEILIYRSFVGAKAHSAYMLCFNFLSFDVGGVGLSVRSTFHCLPSVDAHAVIVCGGKM